MSYDSRCTEIVGQFNNPSISHDFVPTLGKSFEFSNLSARQLRHMRAVCNLFLVCETVYPINCYVQCVVDQYKLQVESEAFFSLLNV